MRIKNKRIHTIILACGVCVLSSVLVCIAFSISAFASTIQYLSLAKVFPRGGSYSLPFKVSGADNVNFDIDGMMAATVKVENGLAVYTLDTSALKTRDYHIFAELTKGDRNTNKHKFPIKVGKVHDNERMSIWRWGGSHENMDDWIEKGFNGNFFSSVKDVPDQKLINLRAHMLNMAAERDYEVGMYLHPLLSKRWEQEKEAQSIGSGGKPSGKPYPLEPAVLA